MRRVNSSNFKKEVLESDKPVLVANINPFFDYESQTKLILEISNFYIDVLKVCMVDEEDPEMITSLGIIGLPTYLIFYQGDEIKRALGVHTNASFLLFVSSALEKCLGPHGFEKLFII